MSFCRDRSNLALFVAGGSAAIYLLMRWQKRTNSSERASNLSACFISHRKEVAVAVELALQCGAAMLLCSGKRNAADWKDDHGIDPVTQTDQDNELLVTKGLAAAFPGHVLIGEEAAAVAGNIPPLGTHTPTWIVDPIDGTQNFTHGAPLSVVSIGLCEEGVPVLGVIYDPYRDEVFAAVKGEGAYLNGQPITCDTSVETLQRAFLTVEVGYERSLEGINAMVGGIGRLLTRNVQSLRILGSTVLSLAWVACGRANAFAVGVHNEGGKPWDYCAGVVVAEEAGVIFRRLDSRSYNANVGDGEAFDIYSKSCVCASTTALADEIVQVLRPE